MARRLGQLESAALALAQMRNLRTMRVGELASGLRLSAKQERELLSRMSRSDMIANVRVEKVRMPSGETLVYSSRARTLVDAVYDWSQFDSLPEAYDWIRADLAAGRISADELARAAVQYGNMGTIRRIGAILERIDVSKIARSRLERAVTKTTAKIPLVPTRPARGPVSRAWAVVINA